VGSALIRSEGLSWEIRAHEAKVDKFFREIIEIADGSSGDYIMTSDGKRIVDHKNIFATVGGLISYGPDSIDPYRPAAGYVDRILKVRSRPTFRCRHRPNMNW
jgi:hypothetical protein